MTMDIEKKYQETLEYLYGFVDYSLTRGLQFSPEKFDLQRMRDFMETLGNPQQTYPVIHVAGTKGKGSVSALVASALRAQGYRVGLYTSPHLHDYAERIQLDGQPISHADFTDLIDEFRPFLDRGTKLTTFEITTALALLYYARQKASVVVLEVGLGGRLDATNIVIPSVAVITSVSMDHMSVLGNTLAEIAAEKAGIIKPGIPVVVAPQQPAAQQVITQIAIERAAPLIQVGDDYGYTLREYSLAGQSMSIWPAAGNQDGAAPDVEVSQPVDLLIPLLGRHQVENAATAYATLLAARNSGIAISLPAIQKGFAEVRWPGRFEVLQLEPAVILDSAHNRDSAYRLMIAVQDYFPGKQVVLVFGASEDKDIHGMFAELLPHVKQMIVTRSFHPRAADPESLQEIAGSYHCPTRVAASVEEALNTAIQLAGQDAIVLVAGSIFIAAEARDNWYNHAANE